MEENNKFFREKSLKKISSPEQLNEIVTVTKPGIWMVFLALITVVIGFIIFGFFGKINATVNGYTVVKDNKVYGYVDAKDYKEITNGKEKTVKIIYENKIYNGEIIDLLGIVDISDAPVSVQYYEGDDEHLGKVEILIEGLKDGEYKSEFITDIINPAQYIFDK